jgi:hypothetical protein
MVPTKNRHQFLKSSLETKELIVSAALMRLIRKLLFPKLLKL